MKTLSAFSKTTIIIAIALSTACQKSESPHSNDTTQPIFLGKLDKKMSEIYDDKNKDYFNVCDYQWRPKILEISRVLEEKREAIEAMAKEDSQESPEKLLDFGPYKFIDKTDTPAGKDEWKAKTFSWSRIAKLYDLVKDDPKDPRWTSLDILARGIVADDSRRIVSGGFNSFTRDAEPMVMEINKKAQACLKDEACVDPMLSKDEEYLLVNSPAHYNNLRLIKSAKRSIADKRKSVERFATRMAILAERYDFHKEPSLKVDGKVLIVPMNLTALGDDGSRLFTEFIEKNWNVDSEYSVKIQPVTDGSSIYTVKVDEGTGRASVARSNYTMQLFNWQSVKVFIHEFGHIIGLQDTYYTSWNTDTCSYTTESNAGDIMSASTTGVVLPHHWEKIKATYWSSEKTE